MTKPSNTWSCPGCSNIVVYKGYGRRGKYCTRDCRLSYKKKLRQAERASRVRVPRLPQRKKFLSLFCKQCGNPLPKGGKLFCSKDCKYRGRYQPKYAHRVSPKHEAEKTARNIAEAGNCSICGNTLARKGWYKVDPHPMIPPGVDLCSRHRRSFGQFVSKNSYGDKDLDEVWTAYLVFLTFANSGGQPYMVMIREAFHAGSIARI